MTDMAVGMIATKAGISVPVDNPVLTDLVGRIAVLVGVLAIVGRSHSRIARSVGACDTARQSTRQQDEHEFPLIDVHVNCPHTNLGDGGWQKKRRAATRPPP